MKRSLKNVIIRESKKLKRLNSEDINKLLSLKNLNEFWLIYLACIEEPRNLWEVSQCYNFMKKDKRGYLVPTTKIYNGKDLTKKMVDNGFLKIIEDKSWKSKKFLSRFKPFNFEKGLHNFLKKEWVRQNILSIENIKLFFKFKEISHISKCPYCGEEKFLIWKDRKGTYLCDDCKSLETKDKEKPIQIKKEYIYFNTDLIERKGDDFLPLFRYFIRRFWILISIDEAFKKNMYSNTFRKKIKRSYSYDRANPLWQLIMDFRFFNFDFENFIRKIYPILIEHKKEFISKDIIAGIKEIKEGMVVLFEDFKPKKKKIKR